MLAVYQYIISPLFPASCRFYPSCSCYARDAIRIHGLLTGTWLILKRIVRCNPLHGGGVDPVPSPNSKKTTW